MELRTEVKLSLGCLEGFLNLLFIAFLFLKLAGYVSWSWWLVFTPLIIEAIIAIVLLVIVVVAFVIYLKS